MDFLLKILINAGIIFLIARLMPRVYIKHFGTAIIVAIVYSIVNFFLGFLLRLLTLPLIFLSLGLFHFVINGILLLITDKLVKDFEIEGFGLTILVALLLSIANIIIF